MKEKLQELETQFAALSDNDTATKLLTVAESIARLADGVDEQHEAEDSTEQADIKPSSAAAIAPPDTSKPRPKGQPHFVENAWFLKVRCSTIPPNRTDLNNRSENSGLGESRQEIFKVQARARPDATGEGTLVPCKTRRTKPMTIRRFFYLWIHSVDFDGDGYIPLETILTFPTFEGLRDVTSLGAYPLHYHVDSEKLIEVATSKGRQFQDAVKAKHMAYCGPTISYSYTGNGYSYRRRPFDGSNPEAYMLLDEADVFLSQRENNLERNALVSVFVRVLEYYNGILFLPTNRVGTLDEAFKSRVHLSLHYPALDRSQTHDIMKMHLSRLRAIEEKLSKATEQKQLVVWEDEICQFAVDRWDKHTANNGQGRWNGRQIRNAVNIAASLAWYDNKTESDPSRKELPPQLMPAHPETVAKTMTLFDGYMSKTRGGKDAFLSHQRSERFNMFRQSELDHENAPYGGAPLGAGQGTGAYQPYSHRQRPQQPSWQQQQMPGQSVAYNQPQPIPPAQGGAQGYMPTQIQGRYTPGIPQTQVGGGTQLNHPGPHIPQTTIYSPAQPSQTRGQYTPVAPQTQASGGMQSNQATGQIPQTAMYNQMQPGNPPLHPGHTYNMNTGGQNQMAQPSVHNAYGILPEAHEQFQGAPMYALDGAG
ncbi:Uu.00g064600.m01.CDS01 [Anthostomella pinea]|uniref:Uu.00g064600.m01.CDS01 n=1 Tax=Anthostomella pinea TaxID=933095 RepID=A0AAI8YN54_9PEZI|nr:Uu.00g064600.m01.CDS01 [Anthostomella pinea]